MNLANKRFITISAIVLFFIVAWLKIPSLKTTIPGRVVRYIFGESGEEQWVNDTVEKLKNAETRLKLESAADQIFAEFSASYTLKRSEFSTGVLAPIDRLPEEFRRLGSSSMDPEIILQGRGSTRSSVVLSWGNLRRAVVVLGKRGVAPSGYYVRRVGERCYVVVNYS